MFSGTRNFIIWMAAVIATIYFIDTYILTRDRLESFVLGKFYGYYMSIYL